jgi:PAS domain S-box-containing protein
MQDENKSKQQLIDELNEMRLKMAEFQNPEVAKRDFPEIKNEEIYRSLFQHMLEGFAYCRMFFDDTGAAQDWVYLDVNPAFVELTGLKNIVGQRVTELIPGIKDKSPELFDIYGGVASTGKAEKFEFYVEPLETWFNLSAYCPKKDHFAVFFEIITERKRNESELREYTKEVEDLYNNAPCGYHSLDRDGVIVRINDTELNWLGYSRDEVKGKMRFSDILTKESSKTFRENFPGFKERSWVKDLEYDLVRKDGTTFPVMLNATAITDDFGNYLMSRSTVFDMTYRNTKELELRESEQRFKILAEASFEGILISRNGVILDANKNVTDISGYNLNELIGMRIADLTTEKYRQVAIKHVELNSEEIYESEGLTKKGSAMPVLIRGKRIIYNGRPARVTSVRDLTLQKKIELEKEALLSQLMESQKMEALGTLVNGIAHDFNNMLAVILGYSQLLLDEKKKGDPGYGDLQAIIRTGQGGADLVRKLLAFGQQSPIFPISLDVNLQVTQVIALLSRTLPQVQIDLDLTDGPTTILADHSQIDQLVVHLAVNASEAMPLGGRLKIATKTVSLDDEYCRTHNGVKPGGYVMLSVSDTGIGMDKETLARIFDPFFSTKEKGSTRGTGLGLSVVQGIVRQHDAHITCESEPRKGTEFKVYFPAIASQRKTKQKAGLSPESGQSRTVLLVEDEPGVADCGRRILTSAGYSVITATNGRKALEIYRLRKDEISLVILDLIMPEMSGRDCLMELVKIDPSVKVLIASGYAPADELHKEISPLVKGFLHKPFAITQLLNEARSVMDSY